jgi:hypothetical protein
VALLFGKNYSQKGIGRADREANSCYALESRYDTVVMAFIVCQGLVDVIIPQ